ncbi:unnamed protein product [Urochloa humidicola]
MTSASFLCRARRLAIPSSHAVPRAPAPSPLSFPHAGATPPRAVAPPTSLRRRPAPALGSPAAAVAILRLAPVVAFLGSAPTVAPCPLAPSLPWWEGRYCSGREAELPLLRKHASSSMPAPIDFPSVSFRSSTARTSKPLAFSLHPIFPLCFFLQSEASSCFVHPSISHAKDSSILSFLDLFLHRTSKSIRAATRATSFPCFSPFSSSSSPIELALLRLAQDGGGDAGSGHEQRWLSSARRR